MIYALATDERCVYVYRDECEATSDAEGIDVENGIWRFFGDTGAPLVLRFTSPNVVGFLGVISGKYHLEPDSSPDAVALDTLLSTVQAVFSGKDTLTVQQLSEMLTSRRSSS